MPLQYSTTISNILEYVQTDPPIEFEKDDLMPYDFIEPQDFKESGYNEIPLKPMSDFC